MNAWTPNALNPESLYLQFADGTQFFLTRDQVTRVTDNYWKDPDKIPEQVRAAVDFQRCSFCPMNNDKQICDALRPILPLLDHIDKFSSIDPVQVIYTSADSKIFHVTNTTAPTALSFVSLLSLIHYCQAGRKFRQYYYDIIPLVSPSALAKRLYLNIYWLHKGNAEEITNITTHFSQNMRLLSENQVKRLRLISHNDAFNNAFVNAYVATSLLMLGIEKQLEKEMKELA